MKKATKNQPSNPFDFNQLTERDDRNHQVFLGKLFYRLENLIVQELADRWENNLQTRIVSDAEKIGYGTFASRLNK